MADRVDLIRYFVPRSFPKDLIMADATPAPAPKKLTKKELRILERQKAAVSPTVVSLAL